MDKLAAIKKAEVQGVLAALVDAELVKVANEDVFNALSDTVCENLDGDYNLNDVLEKTAAIIDAVTSEDAEPLEKEAEETDEVAEALLAHHELVLKKQAGEISDNAFRKEASRIMSGLKGVKSAIGSTTPAEIIVGGGLATGGVLGTKALLNKKKEKKA